MLEKHDNSDSDWDESPQTKKSRHRREPGPSLESTGSTQDRITMSDNAAEVKTDDTLVHTLIISPLSMDIEHLHSGPSHAQSCRIRGPNDYDVHLLASLRLENLAHGPDILSDLRSAVKTRFLQRAELIKLLRRKPREPEFIFTIQSVSEMIDLTTGDESNVSTNEIFLNRLANIAATYALFDLDRNALKRRTKLPSFFSCHQSNEPERKSDLLNGLAWIHRSPPEDTIKQFLDSIAKLPNIFGVQVKNIFAGNPRVFLAIMLLIAITPQVKFPWPKNMCHSCQEFPLAHAKLRDNTQTQIPKPLDASFPEPPIMCTNGELKETIAAVQKFIIEWDQKYDGMSAATSEGGSNSQDEMDPYRQNKEKLASKTPDDIDALQNAVNDLFDAYDVDVALRPSVSAWVLNALHLTIQSWSQMARHDLTYHIVSSHEVAWVIYRNRASQTATVSGFFHPRDQPILTHTGLIIRSYEDALTRFQEGRCKTWTDPCRRRKRRDQESIGQSNADNQADCSLNISQLHLAFQWDTLQSEGFTHMTQVIATDPPNLQHASAPTFSKAGVVLDTLIATTGNARVWGGSMVIEGLGIEKSVVVKMVTDEEGAKRVLQEGATYKHLARSTPAAGPRCYGVFQSENRSTVLVMDDLGDALKFFESCSKAQKSALLDEAISIHESGVYHNDIEPRNVVVDKGGNVHIIDFHLARSDHKCAGAADCWELKDLANELGLSEDYSMSFEMLQASRAG
ncbi:hypothetical protein BD410DRAFT_894832 [Rickenella mellea]|uniref:Protein kinase domain-containing protein n=1 Tax=Rickenella mellea TaxID=50990 RepID=A0A4Y7QJ89_9AGAM|nr:hypothetical protein BD410DRAFT_894832 [Rickenella mellea]